MTAFKCTYGYYCTQSNSLYNYILYIITVWLCVRVCVCVHQGRFENKDFAFIVFLDIIYNIKRKKIYLLLNANVWILIQGQYVLDTISEIHDYRSLEKLISMKAHYQNRKIYQLYCQ